MILFDIDMKVIWPWFEDCSTWYSFEDTLHQQSYEDYLLILDRPFAR